MKKIMFLMAAAMITFGGISAANAQQAKPAAKTEQKAEKKEHKAEKKTEHHHTAKKHAAKKETPAKQ